MASFNLRQRSEYYDLEIKCDGITFYAHRVIVCTKSKVLARECAGRFEVRTSDVFNDAAVENE